MSSPICITRDTLDLTRLAKQQGHKFDHGHALVLSGGPGQTGAARLAARGALRIGAGLVTLGVPPAAQMEVAQQITALMLRRVEDAAALDTLLQDTRINVLCLGPGLGLGHEKPALIEAALKSGRSVVLDADALTLIAGSKPLFNALQEDCLLTPHMGEFGRLFPDLADEMKKGMPKADATRAAALKAGCSVLLKGEETHIADANGFGLCHCATGRRATPWLATAGAGDVLAGFITGLLARGFTPVDAAANATWLHVECAIEFGPGLIAEDLSEMLPQVLKSLT